MVGRRPRLGSRVDRPEPDDDTGPVTAAGTPR
jgi:hypothetical protein